MNNEPEQPKGTILIVDDDADDALLTQRAIRKLAAHFRAQIVNSGEKLISYLQGESDFSDRNKHPYPILVLLDLKMPEMDGFEVLHWLRDHPPHSYIPVVVLTGAGEFQLVRRAYSMGARSFLTKPLQADDFESTLQRLQEWIELMRADKEF